MTRLVSNKEVVFRMYDTSLNGTYINDVRIKDFAVLKEGDKIAFGHLRGAIIDPGELAPQKETEFLFKVTLFIIILILSHIKDHIMLFFLVLSFSVCKNKLEKIFPNRSMDVISEKNLLYIPFKVSLNKHTYLQ